MKMYECAAASIYEWIFLYVLKVVFFCLLKDYLPILIQVRVQGRGTFVETRVFSVIIFIYVCDINNAEFP